MENTNSGIQGIIDKENAKLAVQKFKDGAARFGKAVATTGIILGVGIGALVVADKATDGKVSQFLQHNVPSVTRDVTVSYTVRSGDGYGSIAQHFDQEASDIKYDVYGGRDNAAQVGDLIKYDYRTDAFIGYRNGKQINMVSNNPVERTIETVVSQPVAREQPVQTPRNFGNVDIEDGIARYTVPVNSGIGAWRVSQLLDDITQDDVLKLLEGTQVKGGDIFDVIYNKKGDAEYLGLTRNGNRTYVEVLD
ncbi:hypothetical protein JXM83_04305 [Candidatus Woesearchaeota archaeon]|nr:hypothetical protein [Candidatus Woesearchaeota archaeon]